MENKPNYVPKNSAFSLIELLTVVATIAVIGAIAVALIGNTKQSLTASKLEQDVSRLNTTVKVFLANGGDLTGITTGNDVLTELKKAANAEGQESLVGIRGSSIDNRLHGVDQAHARGSNDVLPRAVWENGKFVLKNSTTGIAEFYYEETLASVDFGAHKLTADNADDRLRKTKLLYNDQNGWVWETVDYNYTTGIGPASLPVLQAPTLGASGGSGSANSARLFAPAISPDSGTRALAAFPLQVSIAKNEGDPESAVIQYSVEPNTWIVYTGPFYVEPGTTVQAFTSHEDPAWENSEATTADYLNNAETLQIALSIPKNPITYAEAGGALEEGDYTPVAGLAPITISLPSTTAIPDKYESSDNFRVQWTYDGSDPLTSSDRFGGGAFTNGYSGDSIEYTLPKWDGAFTLPIKIVASSSNQALFTSSNVLSANININTTDLPSPLISYDDTDTSRGDTVEITKMVDSGDMPVGARIFYTTDGSDPGDDGSGNPVSGTLYTGPFDPLVGDSYSTDADIVARVYAPEGYAGWFNVSEPVGASYEVPDWEISGTSSGWFSNPIGAGNGNNGHGNNLDDYDVSNNGNPDGGPTGGYDASEGVDDEQGNNGQGNAGGNQGHESFIIADNYFQWGDAGNWGTGANWLHFDGSEFENITSNELFEIGDLSYYNGTISMDSIATAVDFTVQLDFGGTPSRFDYAFDLLTTANTGNAWQNADYVWFNNTASAQNVSLFGTDYSLNLEFGETSQYGFSSIDEFHVQEAQSASAKIYARLVQVGSWYP